MTYEIYPERGREPVASIEAEDSRAALTTYAVEHLAIDGLVRRDGAGLLYVGNAHMGRYRARRVPAPADRDAWAARFTKGQPLGMPPVLADAIEGSDWS